MAWRYRQPQFDFDNNDLVLAGGDLRLISGRDLLKQEIEKVIHTELDRFDIYKNLPDDETYGCPLEATFVGATMPQAYVKAEVERIISEALEKLNGVTAVNSFIVEQTDITLKINFMVETELGAIDEEVTV